MDGTIWFYSSVVTVLNTQDYVGSVQVWGDIGGYFTVRKRIFSFRRMTWVTDTRKGYTRIFWWQVRCNWWGKVRCYCLHFLYGMDRERKIRGVSCWTSARKPIIRVKGGWNLDYSRVCAVISWMRLYDVILCERWLPALLPPPGYALLICVPLLWSIISLSSLPFG